MAMHKNVVKNILTENHNFKWNNTGASLAPV